LIAGRIIKLPDNIDTDIIIPTEFLTLKTIKEMSKFAFYPVDPDFSKKVGVGDIIVAGKNFGCGSSREQAPAVLKELGIKAIIAKSFSRLFFRNSITNGLIVIECSEAVKNTHSNETIKIDLKNHKIRTKNKEFLFSEFPQNVQELLAADGLVNYMKKKNKGKP